MERKTYPALPARKREKKFGITPFLKELGHRKSDGTLKQIEKNVVLFPEVSAHVNLSGSAFRI